MFYVADNKTSRAPFEGAIEVGEAVFNACRAAQLSGAGFCIRDGQVVIFSTTRRTVYKTSDGSVLEIPENADTPDGYTDLVPATPHDGWDGNSWVTPPPTQAMVEVERDRRLAVNAFEYDFGDARGVHVIGTDEKDMKAWIDEVMPTAQARFNLGDTTPIDIVTNTGPASVTPLEWFSVINAGSTSRQAIWAAYFALIHTDPIPADFADDQYWP